MNKLFIMVGLPGSGKSTFAKHYLQNDDTIYRSRDEIRFSLLKQGDKYFEKENKVFNIFAETIQKWLKSGYDVIADATHLNLQARAKLLNRLDIKHLKFVEVNIIYMNTPYEMCLNNNDKRYGTKAYVESKRINQMYNSFVTPTLDQNNYIFDKIYIVDPNYNVTIQMRKEEFDNQIFYI